MSIHKPFIRTSPVVFVKWNAVHGLGALEVKCPAVRDLLLLLTYQITRGRDGSLQLQDDHAHYYQCQLQLYTTQRLYCDFVVWTEWNLHISASLRMTHSCKLSFHKLKTFSNYAFYENLYEGSLLKTMVAKYSVMLLMNLKWGKIMEYAWYYCNQMVLTWFSATAMVVVVSFGMPV